MKFSVLAAAACLGGSSFAMPSNATAMKESMRLEEMEKREAQTLGPIFDTFKSFFGGDSGPECGCSTKRSILEQRSPQSSGGPDDVFKNFLKTFGVNVDGAGSGGCDCGSSSSSNNSTSSSTGGSTDGSSSSSSNGSNGSSSNSSNGSSSNSSNGSSSSSNGSNGSSNGSNGSNGSSNGSSMESSSSSSSNGSNGSGNGSNGSNSSNGSSMDSSSSSNNSTSTSTGSSNGQSNQSSNESSNSNGNSNSNSDSTYYIYTYDTDSQGVRHYEISVDGNKSCKHDSKEPLDKPTLQKYANECAAGK